MRAVTELREYCLKSDNIRCHCPAPRLSQNKHFLSVYVRMWTLSRRRRVTWRELAATRESELSVVGRGSVMRCRCSTATSIVFPPIILSKLIYDRLFGRWTVGEAWCVCARACVRRACFHGRRYLPADGARIRRSFATQHPRKLRNDVSAFFSALFYAS